MADQIDLLVAACTKCDYVYKDTPGMGIHRTPIYCPVCGGKIIVRPTK